MSDVLKLENYFLNRLELRMPSDTDEKQARDGQLKLDYDVGRHKEKINVFRLALRVIWTPGIQNGKPEAPEMESEIIGIFSFSMDMPEEKREWLVRYNGGLMLYGLLRGQITAISGAFPTGRMILPSLDMKEAILEIEQRRLKSKADGLPKTPAQTNSSKAKGKKASLKKKNSKSS